jgi:hypothetical protein
MKDKLPNVENAEKLIYLQSKKYYTRTKKLLILKNIS